MAKDISDERFSRRMLDSQLWINSYESEKSIEDDRQSNIEQRLIALQSQMFDKAASYNNIVISFGYAGFFAIWNFVSDQLHSWDTALIALLLGASLLVFIAWTLIVSFHNSVSMRKIASAFTVEYENTEEKLQAVLTKEQEVAVSAFRLQKMWLFVFSFTVATGFLAGFLLIAIMMCRVLNIDFDLVNIFDWIRTGISVW